MMKKKIALQLFGHLRSFAQTIENLNRHFIEPNKKDGYGIDIFIHTWDETDTSNKSWHNIDGQKRGRQVNVADLALIKNAYAPKVIKIEPQIDVKDNFVITEKLLSMPREYRAIINSSYTKFKVNQLRKTYQEDHHILYDYVLMTRPDVSFEKPFRIDDFLNTYKVYNLYIPERVIFTSSVPFRRGNIEPDIFLCSIDLIFFAKPNIIDEITMFYEDIHLGKISKDFLIDNSYSLEILWLKYWQLKNIEIVKLKYFQFKDYELIRDASYYLQINEIRKTEKLKNKIRKIKREFFKLLPYFLVKKKIDKLNSKIYRRFNS